MAENLLSEDLKRYMQDICPYCEQVITLPEDPAAPPPIDALTENPECELLLSSQAISAPKIVAAANCPHKTGSLCGTTKVGWSQRVKLPLFSRGASQPNKKCHACELPHTADKQNRGLLMSARIAIPRYRNRR